MTIRTNSVEDYIYDENAPDNCCFVNKWQMDHKLRYREGYIFGRYDFASSSLSLYFAIRFLSRLCKSSLT
jgi:hypothetical protein